VVEDQHLDVVWTSASPHLKGVFSIVSTMVVQGVVDVAREGEEVRVLDREEVM